VSRTVALGDVMLIMTVLGSIRVGPGGLDETERVTVPLNLACEVTMTLVVLVV
jgi:hypothetical protein